MITLFEAYTYNRHDHPSICLKDISDFFQSDDSKTPLHDIINLKNCLKTLLVGNEIEFVSNTNSYHKSIVTDVGVNRTGARFDITHNGQLFTAGISFLPDNYVYINYPSEETRKCLRDLNSKMKGKRFDL